MSYAMMLDDNMAVLQINMGRVASGSV